MIHYIDLALRAYVLISYIIFIIGTFGIMLNMIQQKEEINYAKTFIMLILAPLSISWIIISFINMLFDEEE